MPSRRDYLMMIALTALAGCTTHYREALVEYRAGEPVPFYQRTMEWVAEAPVTPMEREPAVQSQETEAVDAARPVDRYHDIASRVLGVPTDWFIARTSTLADPGAVERSLEGELLWNELAVAVALLNPSVAAAREQWLATLHQYSQAEFLEGLLREYRSFTGYLDPGAGEMLNAEMIANYFPYPSTTSLKGEMVREQVHIAELEWERVLRDVLVEAGVLFFNYQYQHRGAETVKENVQLVDNLVNVVQDRYATGLASQPDVLRLQAALERQRNLQDDFEARRRMDAAQINALLGRPASAPLGWPGSSDLMHRDASYNELASIALERRQEVLAQAARVARSEIAIRMGEVMNRPLFTQGYSLPRRDMMPGGSTEPFEARASQAPVPAYAQAESFLAEMRLRLAGERRDLDQILSDTQALALTLTEEADIAHRQVVLVRDVVLPLDQSAYDVALRAYTAGDLTFMDLLDAERKLIETRLELIASQRDENQALVRLATVRGFLTGLR